MNDNDYKEEVEYCIINNEKREVGSSFKVIHGTDQCVFCPICHACKNEHFVEEEFKLYCKHYGEIPEKYILQGKLDCKYFEPDKESYDYDMVKKQIEEVKE